jgi:hypothetical protein
MDPRFKAGINMDGTMFGEVAAIGVSQPFFFMNSESALASTGDLKTLDPRRKYELEVDTLDYQRVESWLAKYGGYHLTIAGSLHMNFSDRPLFSPIRRLTGVGTINSGRSMQIINAYTLAFFEKHLNGRQERLLDGPSTDFPEAQFKFYDFRETATQPVKDP